MSLADMPETPRRVRRSARLNIYDSNGRDYLADSIGWTRKDLETWITSPAVRPHLQLWHRICIAGPRRFNDTVEWINSGDRGYFYNPNGLEEDLTLLCLGEGGESETYANEPTIISKWSTQELWARTAWRIVEANRSHDQTFAIRFDKHPAACYSFAIDLLCLAFHSIAYRGAASVYKSLIESNSTREISQKSSVPVTKHNDGETASTAFDSTATSEASDDSSDEDFVDTNVQTPLTSENDDDGEAREESEHTFAPDSPRDLRLIDEYGVPITGYKRC